MRADKLLASGELDHQGLLEGLDEAAVGRNERAAIDLLSGSGWLNRAEFQAVIKVEFGIVEFDENTVIAQVDWAAAAQLESPASSGELAMLRLALSLVGCASIDLGVCLSSLDSANTVRVMDAVAQATGHMYLVGRAR